MADGNYTPGSALMLFASHTKGDALSANIVSKDVDNRATYRLYYFELYSNGSQSPKHRLVPVRRKSDSVVGLYDTVGGNFYGPADNSADFVFRPYITHMRAQQRYPRSGIVDITYEVVGNLGAGRQSWEMPSLLVTATNRADGACHEASVAALFGDTGMEEGVHHVVWDMTSQGLEFQSSDVVFSVAYVVTPPLYCVIDLSAGANAASYPVSYLADVPSGGWTDEYKTTKLVLRRIWPGTFLMSGQYNITLTKSFYCGVFEVTQKQYTLVMGTNPSSYKGDMRPVELVSYDMIRGTTDGAEWPSSSAVDASSFMGKLRAKTGIDFDLPTEAQWEYACRAGTTSKYNNGGDTEDDLKQLGRYYANVSDGRGGYAQHTTVGSYQPNAWGLYDMHGNVWEWCLDWSGGRMDNVADPKGASSGTRRIRHGGSWSEDASFSTATRVYNTLPTKTYSVCGFRLFRTQSTDGDERNSEEAVWATQAGIVLCDGESTFVEIDSRSEVSIIGDNTWFYCHVGEGVIRIVRSEIGQIDSALSIPEVIDNNGVVSIGPNAFVGCGDIEAVTIPASVAEIGDSAFAGCSNFLQVTISGDIRTLTVGGNAFDAITTVAIEQMEGLYFGGWANATGVIISDPFHSSTPLTVSPRWMTEGTEYEEHLIFFEDFERNAMEFELTTVGTFPNPACSQDGKGVDGSRGFGFGRSSVTGNAGSTGCNVNTLTVTFNTRYFITRVEFEEMERYGNWGSKGRIIVNQDNGLWIEQFCRFPTNDKVADSEYRHRDIKVGQMATNISFQVWDMTNVSEEFLDNVKIYGKLARQCTVGFDANGGVGEMAAQTVIEGDALVLASNAFVRTGYLFQGWSMNANDDAIYADGAEIPDVPADMDGTRLYAAWKPRAPAIDSSEDMTFANASQVVSVSHDADDVIVLYTTDGSDPKKHGRECNGEFAVYESCTVRAVAYGAGRYSDEVSVTLTRTEGLSAAVNLYGYVMETDSSNPWTVVTDVSHDGVSSVRSGAVGHGGITWLQTSVRKAGRVSFWWKAACEEAEVEDGETYWYDYGSFYVDGAEKARIAGNDTGWRRVEVEVSSGGKHVLRWEYGKDGATTYSPDCIWLDQVQWIPADGSGHTLTTPAPVPYSWLTGYNLGLDSDFETAAKRHTGKVDASGREMSVWQDYVMGTDPTNPADSLRASISLANDVPTVFWTPNLNTNGEVRIYRVWGKANLTDPDWTYPTNSTHRFFMVTVELP